VPLAEVAGTAQTAQVELLMVGHEEVVRRRGAEALSAVPGHVLDHHECAFGQENEIEKTVSNDGTGVLLDDTWEDAEA